MKLEHGRVLSSLALADYFERIGDYATSAQYSKDYESSIELLASLVDSDRGIDDGLDAFIRDEKYSFKIFSWELASKCTAARRDGASALTNARIDKRYCREFDKYGFSQSEWCKPYAESVYEASCT